MAKDKKRSVMDDMNALNLDDMSAMTDGEQDKLKAGGKRAPKPKKAM